MNIAVYLGSADGNSPLYTAEVKKLGNEIAKGNHTLIYGGSRVGLMGKIADAVLEGGGHVIGVEPGFFVESEIQHPHVADLIVTKTIAERREKMMELANLFIVFPGGTGTLDEMSEVFAMKTLGLINDEPIVLYNLNGFFDPLLEMLDRMTDEGFVTEENRAKLTVVSTFEELKQLL